MVERPFELHSRFPRHGGAIYRALEHKSRLRPDPDPDFKRFDPIRSHHPFTFARTDKERRLLEIYRSFSIAGATFITPPRTPPERVRMLRDAITTAYKNPEFFNDYKKVTGDAPSPLTPDEFDEVLKKLPRDPQDVDLFKKVAGTGPLPRH